MNRYFCQCIVYIFVVYAKTVQSQNFIGDYCVIQRTGVSGACQLLENCQAAIDDLQNGKGYPQTCGFQFNQPIVCCIGGGGGPGTPATPTPSTTKTTTTSTTTRTTTRPVSPVVTPKNPVFLKVGDKAIQKCKEYGQFVYVLEKPPVNLPGSKPYLREDCGVVEVPLIVGGVLAKPKEFPHMALIGFQGENNEKMWMCGGSLVSENFVVTAAHCLSDKTFGDAKYIRVGDLDTSRNTDDAKPQDLNILKLIKHPQFKPPSQYNDIALIEMAKATLNPYVRPICINTEPLATERAIATGWGKLGYTSDVSSQLRKVTLEYFSNAQCNNSYRSNIGAKLKYGILPDAQVCAGSHDESKDTCQGDSGGPLQVFNHKQVYCTYKLVGVTSFGKACGIVNIPGVYTLVSSYVEWLENTVWP